MSNDEKWLVVSRSGSTRSVSSLNSLPDEIVKQGFLHKEAEYLKECAWNFFDLYKSHFVTIWGHDIGM